MRLHVTFHYASEAFYVDRPFRFLSARTSFGPVAGYLPRLSSSRLGFYWADFRHDVRVKYGMKHSYVPLGFRLLFSALCFSNSFWMSSSDISPYFAILLSISPHSSCISFFTSGTVNFLSIMLSSMFYTSSFEIGFSQAFFSYSWGLRSGPYRSLW